jgi:hypothetical protein
MPFPLIPSLRTGLLLATLAFTVNTLPAQTNAPLPLN